MTSSRLDVLKQFLEQEPSDPFNHYAIALEYAAHQMYIEAIKKFQEVIRLDPGYVPAYQQLGLLFSQLGRKSEAQEIFVRGIEVAESSGDAHARAEMQDALDELDG